VAAVDAMVARTAGNVVSTHTLYRLVQDHASASGPLPGASHST